MADWYVATTGSGTGAGTIGDPFTMSQAFTPHASIQPGDTVYFRAGTYTRGTGYLNCYIEGTVGSPIVLRPYPGEWVKIDLYNASDNNAWGALQVLGDYTHWYDFEILSTKPESRKTTETTLVNVGGVGHESVRRGNLDCRAVGNKFINLILHDMTWGITNQHEGIGGEVNGCIIYNNGCISRNGSDTGDYGREHGLYLQNTGTDKLIKDNIVFNNFDYGVHGFASSAGWLDDINLYGNVSFNNGSYTGAVAAKHDFLIGGSIAADDIEVVENMTYHQGLIGSARIGYSFATNGDLLFTDNYFSSGELNFSAAWTSTSSGNTAITATAGSPPSGITVDPAPTTTPTNAIFVRPNDYKTGRGHVIVYNWEDLTSVSVDLSTVLEIGAVYTIHHVYDLFGGAVATGTYAGGSVVVPMTSKTAPQALGGDMPSPMTQTRQFGVFLVQTTTLESLAYYKEKYDETYTTYQATYDVYAASNWGPTYYTFQYVLGGTLSMYEATADLVYLERALAWAETMVSKATIVDYDGKLNWNGNWSASSTYANQNIASFLDEIQGSTELARLARIIITNPTLNATYGTRATAIYNFLRDHVVNKELFDRNALSWHYTYAEDYTGRYYNDKNELLVRVMTDLIRANNVLGVNDTVQQQYTTIVTRLANALKTRLVLASGDPRCDTYGVYSGDALIIDCGLHAPLPHAQDTSHANREAVLLVDLYEAGIVIDLSDVQGFALLLNEVIWDGSLTSPQFRNHVDGNNDTNLGKGPFGLGLVYAGWVRLAQYDATTLEIMDATLRAIIDGVSNPSLDAMDNLHGRAALAGHLAKAVEGTPVAPSVITADGFNAGSLNTTLWEVVDPLSDATVTMTGTQLSVAITGGVKHNMWTDDKNGVRILQQAPDVDFVLKAKIDTLPSARYHDIGLYAEEDANNNIRMALSHNGTTVNASAVKLTSGTASNIASTAITLTAPYYLRLTRVGDAWTGDYSQDGISWTTHFSSHSHAINVAKVGLIILNSHDTASSTPAITALFDTFGDPTDIPPVITTDDFNFALLNEALWQVIDPLDDATITMTGTQLSVAVTGGVKHDYWTAGTRNGVRIMQDVQDGDFVTIAKFDSDATTRFQGQGFIIQESEGKFLRYDYSYDGTNYKLMFAECDNVSTPSIINYATVADTGPPIYLRVTRSGDEWTADYSADGTNWTTHVAAHTFVMTATKAGILVINTGDTDVATPAYTCLVDHFGEPIIPEPEIPGYIVTPADVDAYPVTMSAWVRQDDPAAGTICSLNLSSAANKYFALGVNGSGEPIVVRSNTTLITTTATGADVADGDWHHVMAVLHDATTVSIFVDAVAIVDEATVTSVTLDAGAADQFTLAATETSTGSGYFVGDLADVQLRDAVLDVNDALELMALANIERSITQPAGYSGIKLNLRGSGDITIGWGDGTYDDYTLSGTSTLPEHTYAGTAGYTVSFLGSGQITELRGSGTTDQTRWGGDVAYLPRELTYLSVSGSNTISGALSDLPSGVTSVIISGSNTISGDLADLPSGVTTVQILGSNTISGNVSGLPSGVTSVNISGSNTISGALSGLPSGLTSIVIQGSNTISGALSGLPSGVTSVSVYGSNTISGALSGLPSGVTSVIIQGSNTISIDTIAAAVRTLNIHNLSQVSVDNAIKQAWTHRNTGGTRTYTLNGGTASAPKDTMAALRDALVAGSLGDTTNTITIKTPAIETDDELTYSQIVGAAPLVGFYPTGDAASDAAIASASTVLMAGTATAPFGIALLDPTTLRLFWTDDGVNLRPIHVTDSYSGGTPSPGDLRPIYCSDSEGELLRPIYCVEDGSDIRPIYKRPE